MKTTFLPKSKPGQWSVLLFILFILLTFLGSYLSRALNNEIEYPNPLNSPVLGTVIYAAKKGNKITMHKTSK